MVKKTHKTLKVGVKGKEVRKWRVNQETVPKDGHNTKTGRPPLLGQNRRQSSNSMNDIPLPFSITSSMAHENDDNSSMLEGGRSENQSIISSSTTTGAAMSVGTADETIVRRGDGAIIPKRPPDISVSIVPDGKGSAGGTNSPWSQGSNCDDFKSTFSGSGVETDDVALKKAGCRCSCM